MFGAWLFEPAVLYVPEDGNVLRGTSSWGWWCVLWATGLTAWSACSDCVQLIDDNAEHLSQIDVPSSGLQSVRKKNIFSHPFFFT